MENIRRSTLSDTVAGLTPVIERAASGAHEVVDKAAGTAASAAKLAGEKGDQLMAAQGRYLEGARERVRGNPLAAVGIAAAVGLIVSFLLTRR